MTKSETAQLKFVDVVFFFVSSACDLRERSK